MKSFEKYTVKVLSDTYTLISDQSEQSINDSVDLLNQTIEAILQKAPDVDVKKAVVLAGLKIAHQSILDKKQLDLIDQTEQSLVKYIDEELI